MSKELRCVKLKTRCYFVSTDDIQLLGFGMLVACMVVEICEGINSVASVTFKITFNERTEPETVHP